MRKRFLRRLATAIVVLATVCFFVACGAGAEISVSLDKKKLTMIAGDTETIVAEVSGSNDEVVWTSSDEKVAKVKNGVVEAVASGNATITATVGEKSDVAEVRVVSREAMPVLLLNKDSLSLKVGNEFTLSGTCASAGEPIEFTVSFESSDESIATVNANGAVKAMSKGECTITATANAMGLVVKAKCELTVVPDVEIKVSESEIKLSLIELVAEDKSSYAPNAEVWYNGNKTTTEVNYATDDSSVFTVENGVVVAVGEGNANLSISATVDGENVDKIIPVTVKRTLCESFDVQLVSKDAVLLNKAVSGYKTSAELEISVEPYCADLIIEWSVTGDVATLSQGADKRIATVSAKEGTKGGVATVSVTVEKDGSTTKTFNVTVYVPISTEADFYGINDNKVEGFDSFSPVAGLPDAVFADVKTQCKGIIPGYYVLTNDIVLKNNDPDNTKANSDGVRYYEKAIIGRPTNWANLGYAFTGVFDGNGYKISQARFNINGAYIGVFGTNYGLIRNLEVELSPWAWSADFPTYTLRKYAGAIVAFNVGVIENCKAVTEINVDNGGGSAYSAGLVYVNAFWASKISNCFVEVRATRCYKGDLDACNVGAFVGTAGNGNINNVYGLSSGMTEKVVDIVNKQQYATVNNCAVKSSLSELKEAGFDASRYDSAKWNFVETDGELSVSLKDGCTLAKNA